MTASPLFMLKQVGIRRANQTLFDDFNWQVNPSEHWAIVGPTGSGKTTLLECLKGRVPTFGGTFAHPDLSQVALVARDFSGHRLANQAFLYYQQRYNGYDADLAPSVRDFLTDQLRPLFTTNDASVALPPPACSEHELHDLAQVMRIGHLMERKLTSLSNGETRRTLLAKSLVAKPSVLLLDNPFVGLDVASRQALHQILNDLAQRGITLVMVTTPSEIPSVVQRVLVLGEAGQYYATQPEALANTMRPSTVASRSEASLPPPTDVNFEWVVRMRNVCVSYAGVRVLDHLNWQVRRGEKWALLGPNGSGKSTLLSLITADNPQSYANDFDLFDRKRGSGESIWDIKRRIGFVSPEVHLYSPRTSKVFAAVASGLFDASGLYRELTAAQRTQVSQTLSLLGIEQLADKTLLQLSTGQQRLVLLARALVKNPPLLILDEPCQGLSAEHQGAFKALVERLCNQPDRTLIYVTHYADEIPNVVRHTLELSEGRVVLEK